MRKKNLYNLIDNKRIDNESSRPIQTKKIMESCKRKNSNRKKQKKTDKTKISSNQIKKKVKEKNDKNQLK